MYSQTILKMARFTPFDCLVLLVVAVFSQRCIAQAALDSDSCKCIPGDDCWPSAQAWAEFNATVGGKLIAEGQLAAVCHNPTYDKAACDYIRDNWNLPWLQFVPTTIALHQDVWKRS